MHSHSLRRVSLLLLILALAVQTRPTMAEPIGPSATGTVAIVDFAFQPTPLTVNVGTTVLWTNRGFELHTTTKPGLWDSGDLSPNGTPFPVTFNRPGRFDYVCMRHFGMAGTVVVRGPVPPDRTPPVISAIRVTAIACGAATVTWTTNEAAATRVQYGKTASYGSTATVAGLRTRHVVRLTGLTPATRYHFRVATQDRAGNRRNSADLTFRTTP